MSEDLSHNGEKIQKICEYKLIEDNLHGGLIPSFSFLQEKMRSAEFEELHTLYITLEKAASAWLKKIYTFFPSIEELTVEEKGQLAVAFSEKLYEEGE